MAHLNFQLENEVDSFKALQKEQVLMVYCQVVAMLACVPLLAFVLHDI